MHAITRLIISHWLDPFVPFSEDFKKSIFKKLKSSSQQNLVQENGLLEPPSKKKRKIDSENFEVLFLSETQAGKQTENHLPITSEDCIENVSFKGEYLLSVGSLNKVLKENTILHGLNSSEEKMKVLNKFNIFFCHNR